MNEDEARELLKSELACFYTLSYQALTQHIHSPSVIRTIQHNGTPYQVEIKVVWNQRYREDVCVIGAIHDGGWRALLPLVESFVVTPQGEIRHTRGI